MPITHLIAQQAQRTPDAPAILGADSAVTYAQFAMRVQAAATVLMKHGVKPGDGLALYLPQSLYWRWAFTLGALRIGACPLAVHPSATGDLQGAPVCQHLLVARGDQLPTPAGLQRIELDEDALRLLITTRLVVGLPALAEAEPQAAVLLLAHASHGGPRVVRLSASLLHLRANLARIRHGYTSDARTLCALAFDDGLGMQHALATWMAGGAVVLNPSAEDIGGAVRLHQPSHIVTTPLGIGQLLKAFNEPAPGQAGRVLVVTDGMLPQEWAEKALERLGSELRVVYATAETSEIAQGNEQGLARHPGAMGTPWPEVELEVVEPDGRPCPPLKAGLLRVRSALTVKAHLADFARPGALPAFHDGWVYCEHAAWLTPQGRLAITGPAAAGAFAALVASVPAQPLVPGQGVALTVLEAAVNALPEVTEACVLVLHRDDAPPMPVVAVVCEPTVNLDALAAQIEVIRPGVPTFHLVRVPPLPRLDDGQIDRERLSRSVARGLTGPLTLKPAPAAGA